MTKSSHEANAVKDRVRITQSAREELATIVPRQAARSEVIRHLSKLEYWQPGDSSAIDVDVVDIPEAGCRELCLSDGFGFQDGIRAAFFVDVLASPRGTIWVVGFRRDGEEPTSEKVRIYRARMELVDSIC